MKDYTLFSFTCEDEEVKPVYILHVLVKLSVQVNFHNRV